MSFNTVDQGLLRTRNDEIDLLWKGIDAGSGGDEMNGTDIVFKRKGD